MDGGRVVRADSGVWIDPARLSGEPCCGGTRVPVYMVVAMVWEHGVDEAMDTWSLTRGQVLCACWYAAAGGPVYLWSSRTRGLLRRHRSPWPSRWRVWAEEHHGLLWHHAYDDCPDPPTVDTTPKPCSCGKDAVEDGGAEGVCECCSECQPALTKRQESSDA
jgi:uncharacterized protein (DUF433 family)